MRNYDKPKTPEDTPPVVDPKIKPKSAAEMEAEGEREGEVLDHNTEDEEIAVERALGAAQEGGRDGSGEASLDNLPPD